MYSITLNLCQKIQKSINHEHTSNAYTYDQHPLLVFFLHKDAVSSLHYCYDGVSNAQTHSRDNMLMEGDGTR